MKTYLSGHLGRYWFGGNKTDVAVKSDTADKSTPKKHSSSSKSLKSTSLNADVNMSSEIQTSFDWQNILKFFVENYQMGNVYFEDNNIKNTFIEIFQLLA